MHRSQIKPYSYLNTAVLKLLDSIVTYTIRTAFFFSLFYVKPVYSQILTPNLVFVSDESWKVTSTYYPNWERLDYDDETWSFAKAPSPFATGPTPVVAGAESMWGDNDVDPEYYFRKVVELDRLPRRVQLQYSIDDQVRIYINGEFVAINNNIYNVHSLDATEFFKCGQNIIALKAQQVSPESPSMISLKGEVFYSSSSITSVDTPICKARVFRNSKGEEFEAPGTVYDTLTGYTQCDSIVRYNLIEARYVEREVNGSFCSGSSYVLPSGKQVSLEGQYLDTVRSIASCDTIFRVSLTEKKRLPVLNLTTKPSCYRKVDGELMFTINGYDSIPFNIYIDTIKVPPSGVLKGLRSGAISC
jgi:hypothetical protein